MAARTNEAPMDFAWEDGKGPIDLDAPFLSAIQRQKAAAAKPSLATSLHAKRSSCCSMLRQVMANWLLQAPAVNLSLHPNPRIPCSPAFAQPLTRQPSSPTSLVPHHPKSRCRQRRTLTPSAHRENSMSSSRPAGRLQTRQTTSTLTPKPRQI